MRLLAGEVPEETRFVALLGSDDTTSLADGTGLIRWRSPLELELESSATDQFWLYAFTLEDLAGFTLPPDSELENHAIGLALDVDPLLSASWVGNASGDESIAELHGDDTPPRITAAWLPRCPSLLPEGVQGYADLRCSPPCHATARQTECTLEIDLGACSNPEVLGQIDGRGRVTMSGQVLRRCEPLPREPGFAAAMDCLGNLPGVDRCRIELHEPKSGEPFRIESRSIHDAPFRPGPDHFLLGRIGYLFGLVLLDEVVVVGANQGQVTRFHCDAAEPGRGEVVYLDPETLETVHTTTLTGCLTALGPHPEHGVLAAVGDPTAQTLVHLDAQGRIVRALPLPRATERTSLSTVDIAAFGGRVAILVLELPPTSFDDQVLRLWTFDADLQEPPKISAHLGRHSDRLVVSDLGFVVIDRDEDQLFVLDADSRIVRQEQFDEPCGFGLLRTRWGSADPDLGIFASIGSPRSGGVARFFGGDPISCTWGTYFENSATPYAIVRASEDSPHMVVGLKSDDARALALLSRYDFASARFVAPSQPVGKGAVSEAKRDALGRLWFLLPEDDRVIRATLAVP